MRFLRHDLHSLAGPYALDALEAGSERDRFTRHLSRCQSCAAEVEGFREVATAMAFAAAAEPPAELRGRVLAAAARTRQLPPEVSTHARPRRSRTGVPWVPIPSISMISRCARQAASQRWPAMWMFV